MRFLIQGKSRTGFDGGWTSDLVASDDETAIFDTRADAEKSIDALVRLGWPRNELRIIEVDVCNPSPMGADNARLIASAPVLLDALQWLLKHDPDGDGGMPDYKELRHVCDRARAAVRCAIGDA